MRRVDIAVDIGLQRRVDGDKAHSTNQLGIVRYLLRTKQQFVTIEIEVSQYLCHLALYQTQRATGSELAMSGFDEIDHGVLNHFGVHLKRRDMRVLTQLAEHGIRHISYTRLNRQERCRDTTFAKFLFQEKRHILADLSRYGINGRESRNLIRTIGLHHSRYLGGIYLDMVRAAAVGGFVDRYLLAIRRVKRLIQVVHSTHRSREHLIELNDDLIRHATDSRHDTDTCCRDDCAILAYIRCLDNRPFGLGQKTVTQVLRHVAQVCIEIVCTFGVDLLTHRLVRLVRCAELDRMSTSQRSVTTVAHRSTCLESYAERNTLLVQFLRALC